MSRILLAEDDNDMRRFLVKALQNAGYEVVSFDNGKSAYERIREEPFTLLLTDIVMPEMDGIELARRATELDPDLKVMFITGFAAVALNPESERAAGGQGAFQALPPQGPGQRGREASRRVKGGRRTSGGRAARLDSAGPGLIRSGQIFRPCDGMVVRAGQRPMKIRNSLRSLRNRHRANRLVRRKGRVYVINKSNPRFKARQG